MMTSQNSSQLSLGDEMISCYIVGHAQRLLLKMSLNTCHVMRTCLRVYVVKAKGGETGGVKEFTVLDKGSVLLLTGSNICSSCIPHTCMKSQSKAWQQSL